MMTDQIFFSPDKPWFWPVKLMNIIIIFLPYAGSRSLYGIVVQVFAGKLVKNSFTRFWVPFRDFRPFYVCLYIPSVSSYGGVGSLQGSSYICISMKLDPFRCPAHDRKSQQSRTFFFKGFSAKQQKKPKKAANYSVIEQNALSDKHPKMTGQNDRPDESLTGQARNQTGHCPLTGRYFEPCIVSKLLMKYIVWWPETGGERIRWK